MPVVEGRRPVIRLVREGLHSGDWAWAFVKRVPRRARASMCGVRTCGCPPRAPIQSFWSSMAMNRMFGFVGSGGFWRRGADRARGREQDGERPFAWGCSIVSPGGSDDGSGTRRSTGAVVVS